jgi:hypothetical protein
MWTQRNQRSKELEIDLDELETDGNVTTAVLADRVRQQALPQNTLKQINLSRTNQSQQQIPP